MFQIDNFAAGLIPNAAWSNFRNVAASDWKDLRVNPQGFLIQRDGHREVFHTDASTQIFAYRTLIFAIIDGQLRWARARGRGGEITFNDFDPVLELNIEHFYHFQPVQTAAQEYILLSNGTGEPEHRRGGPYCIDLTDVFDADSPQAPTVWRCYLPEPNNPYDIRTQHYNLENTNNDNEDYHDDNQILFYFQSVRTAKKQERVPWIYDFTSRDELPELEPTIAVSEAVPAYQIEGQDPFRVSYEARDYNEREVLIRATQVEGSDAAANLVLNTATSPDSVKTVGDAGGWQIAPGSIRVELTGYTLVLDLRSTVKLQVRTNGGSWQDVGENRDWLDQTIPSHDTVAVNYSTYSLGQLAPDTVIEFRITATNGEIELLDNPVITLQKSAEILVKTTAIANLENVDGEDIREQYDRQPYTQVKFSLNLTQPEGADYVDVYRSRRRDPPAPYREGYLHIARLPYEDTFRFSVKIPVSDDLLILNWENDLPEQGELATWSYADVDQVRMYAADPKESRLYLSYFDGIATRHFMNLTDFVNLPLAGDPITGVKFLDDTYLAVYTAHRILLVYTDPAPELCRVAGQYSQGPNDEAVGCIAPRSLVEVGQYHYFLSANKRIYRFGGRRPRWTSSHIQPLLEPLAIAEADDASVELSNAVGVAFKGDYLLSFPSLDEEPIHYVYWKGQPLQWKEGNLEWKEDFFSPNNTVIFDIDRDKWYRDGFGVQSYTKDARDRLYGVVDGNILALYDDPETEETVYWEWHSNYLMMPPRTVIYNVCVKTQIAVDLTVTVRTEEGSQTAELSAVDGNDYWGQYAGFNLRGRTARISITGRGATVIDRITINEEVR